MASFFYRVISSFTALLDGQRLLFVLLSFTRFYRVLPSFTVFDLVLLSLALFYWVLPSFSWVLP